MYLVASDPTLAITRDMWVQLSYVSCNIYNYISNARRNPTTNATDNYYFKVDIKFICKPSLTS